MSCCLVRASRALLMSLNIFFLRWLLFGLVAGGIDCFPVAMPDHADSLGFVVRISLRTNSEDRVVIDGVPIGGHVGLSIGFVVAGCLIGA
jgi:hypothetical protein